MTRWSSMHTDKKTHLTSTSTNEQQGYLLPYTNILFAIQFLQGVTSPVMWESWPSEFILGSNKDCHYIAAI